MSVAEVFLPERLGRRANLHTRRIQYQLNVRIIILLLTSHGCGRLKPFRYTPLSGVQLATLVRPKGVKLLSLCTSVKFVSY
jgi:hypothetical protein